jgi:hypothetical protein
MAGGSSLVSSDDNTIMVTAGVDYLYVNGQYVLIAHAFNRLFGISTLNEVVADETDELSDEDVSLALSLKRKYSVGIDPDFVDHLYAQGMQPEDEHLFI